MVKVPELDGVRGIAILLVLLHHFEPPPGIPKVFGAVTYLGWSGVDLFFVLSGFLITGILLDTKESGNYFSSFYARRVLRIFPLYLLTVFVYFRLLTPGNPMEPWFWSHLSNWKSAFGQDVPMLSHFWSLAIEEQFYLVWPLVVFLVPGRVFPWAAAIVAAASLAGRLLFAQHGLHHNFLYRLTPFRVEPLALGALAVCMARAGLLKRWIPWIAAGSAVLFAAALLLGRTNRPFHAPLATWGFTPLALGYACLVYTAGTRSVGILRNPMLRAFGKYSYAIYVFHVPVAQIYNPAVTRISETISPALRLPFWMLTTSVAICLSFGVALLSWNLVEKHFLKLKDRFGAKVAQPDSAKGAARTSKLVSN